MATELSQKAGLFLRELAALRYAGDVDGAIRAIDRLFFDRRPGDPLLAQIADGLFRTVALEKSLSARLFCHLVARFSWRDAHGPLAQAYPAEHSAVLARLAAEDWYQDLRTRAAQSGEWLTAYAVDRGGQAVLPPRPFSDAEMDQATALLSTLWEHDEFLLERFDARNLAALRERIEGPPRIIVPSRAQQVGEALDGLFGAFLKRGFWHALGQAIGSVLLAGLALLVLIPLYPLVRVLKWVFPETMGAKRPSDSPPAGPPAADAEATRSAGSELTPQDKSSA